MKHRRFGSSLLVCAALCMGVGALDVSTDVSLAGVALGQTQDAIRAVNGALPKAAGDKRSDTVLLPLLAKMDPSPRTVSTPAQAALMPAGSPDFAAAAAWAQGVNQKAVLEALDKVTKETDWKKAYVFGQPYGVEGATPELIQARLYTELGDPPMLAGAQHLYMPALDNMLALVHVEATRLAAEGKPSDAIDLLIDMVFFGRQMCDRQFFVEVEWGMRTIASGQERIRDVAYMDLRTQKKIDDARIPDQIRRMKEENLGYLDLDRVRFPVGNRLAAEQIISRVYDERGTMDANVFATTMSRLGSSERPLRLFAEAGRWKGVAHQQAGGFEAQDKVKAVYADFARRWGSPFFDSMRLMVSEYSKLDRSKNAAIDLTTPDMTQLIDLRQLARVECAATRMSLALTGFTLRNGNIPGTITAVRPLWAEKIESDPYDLAVREVDRDMLQYFLPMPKPRSPRDVAKPHEMQVFTSAGETNFKVDFFNDVWILYSIGTDNANNGAKRVQNTHKIVQGADYLLWPPMISLYRQHLIDRGDLKVTDGTDQAAKSTEKTE